jgi:hypothetical protein
MFRPTILSTIRNGPASVSDGPIPEIDLEPALYRALGFFILSNGVLNCYRPSGPLP